MAIRHKSVETKFYEDRERVMKALRNCDRRTFPEDHRRHDGRGDGERPDAAAYLPAGGGRRRVDDQRIGRARARKVRRPFVFAYISDAHLYERTLNQRFVRAIVKAVDDVNALDPQPDFVLYGGDLAQLGSPAQLEMGRQILSGLKAPVKMMVGEHDWFLDLGEKWQELVRSADLLVRLEGRPLRGPAERVRKGLLDRAQDDARGADADGRRPGQRRSSRASRSATQQREWLKNDLAKVPATTPLIVFSHSPLYKYYRNWNFWTEDAEEVQAILSPYDKVTVIHGHTHQMLLNQIGNISFYGMLSTAWPWPYAPEGLPPLTIQMNRADPFDQFDGCGDGQFTARADALVDTIYNLWDRNPVTVKASYLVSRGTLDRPPAPQFASY